MSERLETAWGCIAGILVASLLVATGMTVAAYGPALQGAFIVGLIIFSVYYYVTPPRSAGIVDLKWHHKLSIAASAVALIVLLVALAPLAIKTGFKIPYAFFIFLRWVVFSAIIVLLFFHLELWFKALLLIVAGLYNPFFMVHLGTRSAWACCNICTMSIFVVAWLVILKGNRIHL